MKATLFCFFSIITPQRFPLHLVLLTLHLSGREKFIGALRVLGLSPGPRIPGVRLELKITGSHKSFQSHHNLTKAIHDDVCDIFLVFG